MAKNGGDSFGEGCAGCVMLVFIGAVVFVGCEMNDAPESDRKPEAATTQSSEPDWRLEDEDVSGGNETLWIDMYKSVKLDLLDVSVQDLNSESFSLDHLDDDEGLTAADVEVKLLSKPKHGTVKLNKADGKATYVPRSDFRGTDKIRYSLKLKGKPEVAEATYSITVELSPGGRYHEQQSQESFENCAAARAAGAAPVRKGEPGYGPHLDRDRDGIGCDWG
ncbi:Excalibur calcium-binding domain protein [Streptomyces sp. ADI97-07]|uniref:excalibur calcium-binding domain-containing protein n=1 Tax=Streptomyces sp. ADI97-07 TaxID=1522762 RepID=UPI000F92D1C1|nr:excalibur calcium-binding domain-containing protein [Streptomyces sp. ADI97-07]RPK76012.1 Excalibur calcium-binding domain protein [Streptomyces sp. ADI97-07]